MFFYDYLNASKTIKQITYLKTTLEYLSYRTNNNISEYKNMDYFVIHVNNINI